MPSERSRIIASTVILPEGGSGSAVRLDLWLKGQFPELSRTALQEMIATGRVHVNGQQPKKRLVVTPGDEVAVDFPIEHPVILEAEKIPLSVVYEDEWLLVVNKPAGMVVHPAPGHQSGTFLHAILGSLSKELVEEGSSRPGIVHRLDKDTSGLLIAAKERSTHEQLTRAFAARQVKKEYVAVCRGMPGNGLFNDWLGRDPDHRQRFAVVAPASGKEAITTCKTVATTDGYDSTSSPTPSPGGTGRTGRRRFPTAPRAW